MKKTYEPKEAFELALAHWNYLVDNPGDKGTFEPAESWYNECIFCEHMSQLNDDGNCEGCLMKGKWRYLHPGGIIRTRLHCMAWVDGDTYYDKWGSCEYNSYDKAFFALLMVENIQEVYDGYR